MTLALDDEDLSFPVTTTGGARHHLDLSTGRRPDASSSQDSASANSAPGRVRSSEQRLGHYIIIKTLGEGSFGKVKLAVHQLSGQKVALKIISRRKLVNRDMAGRVEREIQYLQLLRHPHIIKLSVIPLPWSGERMIPGAHAADA